jgi:general secretion pathway protein C
MIDTMRLRLDLPALVTAVLATILGLQVAYLVTTGFRSHEASIDTPAPMAVPTADTTQTVLAALKRAALFGREGSANQPIVASSATHLGLTGVIAETDPAAGQAIITDSGGPAKVYRVGSTLPGNLILNAVHADHVILDRGGSLERLDLPRQLAPGSGLDAGPASALLGGASQPASAEAGLANVIRWQAVIRGGQSPGIRVYPGADARAFTRLGLEAGDLIVAINDAPLSDQANGDAFLRSLSGMPQASLTIERAGRTQNILIDLASLASAGAN